MIRKLGLTFATLFVFVLIGISVGSCGGTNGYPAAANGMKF